MVGHPSGISPPLTKAQQTILDKTYYENRNYFGRDKIWHIVQKKGISRRQVAEWLGHQEVSQLYRVTRKAKTINPTVLKEPFKTVAIDLMDMGTIAVRGYTWILTAVDMFTKKLWAEPMKNKEGKTVATAMRKVIHRMAQLPHAIRSDNGSERIQTGPQR